MKIFCENKISTNSNDFHPKFVVNFRQLNDSKDLRLIKYGWPNGNIVRFSFTNIASMAFVRLVLCMNQ